VSRVCRFVAWLLDWHAADAMEQLVEQAGAVVQWVRSDLVAKVASGQPPSAAWHDKHAESMALALLMALVVLAAVHGVASR
jgi:glycerol kinase